MKGVIFNLLEEVVTSKHGSNLWMELVDSSGAGGAYTSLGSYPDEELLSLVQSAAAKLNLGRDDILRWFGRAAIPLLQERYDTFFVQHRSARSFIMSVNDIIHPEVRKLYSGAGCPHFHFHEADQGKLIVGYQSARQLCSLAHGFIEGASDHFRESVHVDHLSCMNKGAPLCRIELSWG